MTTEEKAKAYDEALKRAKAAIDIAADKDLVKGVAITIFPQLCESEDERIRRTLVEYFGPQAQLDFIRGVPIQKIRDWLEKQKEQKEIPLMNGDADLYFDNWIQHNDTTKRGCFEEGIRYAQRLQKEEKLDSIRIKCKEHDERREEIRMTEIIESIIRVYGKTQGEWIGGYDIDTLIHWVREAFDCLNKQNIQKEQEPSINIDQLKSLMLQYLQEAANEKDDSDIEADTDKWARKILGYDFEQKPADNKKIGQYCGVRFSNRTQNGLLKIKVTNQACGKYKEDQR